MSAWGQLQPLQVLSCSVTLLVIGWFRWFSHSLFSREAGLSCIGIFYWHEASTALQDIHWAETGYCLVRVQFSWSARQLTHSSQQGNSNFFRHKLVSWHVNTLNDILSCHTPVINLSINQCTCEHVIIVCPWKKQCLYAMLDSMSYLGHVSHKLVVSYGQREGALGPLTVPK